MQQSATPPNADRFSVEVSYKNSETVNPDYKGKKGNSDHALVKKRNPISS